MAAARHRGRFAYLFGPHLPHIAVLIVALTVSYNTSAASGQGTVQTDPAPEAQPKSDRLVEEIVEARHKEAAESKDLDDESKKKVAELYRLASEALNRANELTTREADFKSRVENIEDRILQIKQQAELFGKQPEPTPLTAATLAELQAEQAKQQLRLTELKNALAKAEAEPKIRANQRKELRAVLLSAPERLAENQKQLDATAPTDEKPLITLARRTELLARRQMLLCEAPAIQAELAMYDAEEAVGLLRQQRDLRAQEVALAEKHLALLDQLVKKKRAEADAEAVRQAREDAIRAEPALKDLARRNEELAEAAPGLTHKIELAEKELQTVKLDLEDLKKKFKKTTDKIDRVGLTGAIGLLLRKERAELPNLAERRNNIRNRRKLSEQTQYELFKYDDEQNKLPVDTEALVEEILETAGTDDPLRWRKLEESARVVVDRQREYLGTLIGKYNKYSDTLIELDITEQELIKQAQSYIRFIDERVLWIRSGEYLHAQFDLDDSDKSFLDARRWLGLASQLWIDILQTPIPFACAILLFASLFRFQFRFRKELRQIGQLVERATCCRAAPTLRAVFLTIVLAIPWPGIVCYVAWRVRSMADGDAFADGVAYGLLSTAGVYFSLELFRQICRTRGLAESHFAWPTSAVQVIRRNLRWLMTLGLPLVFVTSALYASDPQHGIDSPERICFILAVFVFSAFLRQVLHPAGGTFQQYIAYHRGGWVDHLKHVWYWLGVLSPLALAALAYGGYFYTARQLSWRLYATIWLILLLVLLRSFLLRLVLMHRRRLSMEQAKERRAAAIAAQETREPSVSRSPAEPVPAPLDEQLDLATISDQAQRFLNAILFTTALVGCWMIWVEVLPALNFLDRWPLWTTTIQVAEEVSDEAALGETKTRTVDKVQDITAAHLAFAIIIAVVTLIAAKNVPGLLEMSLLQRLPVDAGIRYAITTLASYSIILLGIIVAFARIGIGWSHIQWLATALTFGLAFGLQEIFANFVAGLIILFERPVRVGDVVTVDDVTGTVTRIRIRATTITNWDRKEFIVPNKEFITGRLLNWTLSNKINRIVITVGIAYGSDTERATDLLLKVVNDHPLILDDPKTMVTFEGFGDSSLIFNVRTYLPDMDNRLITIHDLHTAIDQAFREAGIEIAFPQRDLHLRSVPEAFPSPGSRTAAPDSRHDASEDGSSGGEGSDQGTPTTHPDGDVKQDG